MHSAKATPAAKGKDADNKRMLTRGRGRKVAVIKAVIEVQLLLLILFLAALFFPPPTHTGL